MSSGEYSIVLPTLEYPNFPSFLGFQFPSQIVELITILFIMLLLLRIERSGRAAQRLYGHYIIYYGVTRFALNWFRYGLTPFVWILPAGNFWSLVSIALGAAWILLMRRKMRI